MFFLFSCSTSTKESIKNIKGNGVFVQKISVSDLDEIISSGDFTIIYCWGTWCSPCLTTLGSEINNILDTLNNERIKIIPICIGGNEEKSLEVLKKIKFKYGSYLFSKTGNSLDKYFMNDMLKQLFPNYKKQNYLPLVLLVDKNKNIINFNKDEDDYLSFLESLLSLKNHL
jgi:thiol-disulfide isomerase/thioredoxin